MYMRMSISAQSCASTPPAPALMESTASSRSLSLRSIFLNSNSSTFFCVAAIWATSSSSVASPASKNSPITSRSPQAASTSL